MIGTDTRVGLRIAALVAALVLAFGAGACGGSDDDGDAANVSAQDGAGQADGGGAATPEEEIRTLYTSFIQSMYKKDVKDMCGKITPEGQKRFVKQTEQLITTGKTCTSRLKAMLDAWELGESKPRIVKMDVNGDKATILTRTGDSERYPVTFVKANGEWKINGGWTGN